MTPASRREDAAHAARSGVVQTLTMVGNGILMPLHRVLVSRLFGLTAYGIYRAGADLCEVLTRGGMAGSDKAMLRFVAAHRGAGETADETRALGSGLRLAGRVLTIGALALALAAPWVPRLLGNAFNVTVLRILAPSIVAAGLMLVLTAATLAAKVTRVNLLVRGAAEPLLLIGLTVAAWAVWPTVAGAAAAHLAAYGLLLAVAWVAAGTIFGRPRLGSALRAPPHPGLARFALPLGASELMNGILQRANVFILSGFLGAPAVAVFAAAEELGRPAAGVRYAFDAVVGPMLAESLQQGDRERTRYALALVTRWVASAAAPIALTLLALRPELLSIYGAGYSGGVTAMTLLVVGHLVNGVLGLTAGVLVMSGRSKLFFWNNFGAALLNLVLSFALIPRWGVTGAAIASLASVAALQAALCVEAFVLERIHPFEWALAKPFMAALVALSAELLVRHALGAVPAVARAGAVIVAGVIVYPTALLALRPGEEERRFVLALVRRVLGRRREPPP